MCQMSLEGLYVLGVCALILEIIGEERELFRVHGVVDVQHVELHGYIFDVRIAA